MRWTLVMSANPTLCAAPCRGSSTATTSTSAGSASCIDLFNSARFTRQGEGRARDLLGEVYEYFLEKFARAEGKRGGEFYTPASVVKVLVEVLEPDHGRVYDPCCGSGGMFVQTEKFIYDHDGDPKDVAIYGQENNERTWRMAKMNLAIHGIDNKGLHTRWGDTFVRDYHADMQMDFVMANPPFNIKDWTRIEEDPRWRYGVPPAGNANYAWIQHILSKLAPGGQAGVVMANGSMSTQLWRRGPDPRADRRGRPGVVHGRAADPALPQHRHPGVPVVLREGQDGRQAVARSTGPGRCCSSTRASWATWSTAPSGRSPTRTSRGSRTPTTRGAGSSRLRQRTVRTRTSPASARRSRWRTSRPRTTP